MERGEDTLRAFLFGTGAHARAAMAFADAATPNLTATLPEGFRAGTIRGAAGFFRTGQDEGGRWWLIDAEGRPFFCRAVHGVRAAAAEEIAARQIGGTGTSAPDEPAVERLRRWGFNAAGVGSDGAAREAGVAWIGNVDFCRTGGVIQAPGVRLPDVFDLDWPRLAVLRAFDACAPWLLNRELIGWVADDLPGWGQANPRWPGLLQVCLSLEPNFAAYHAAWEFVLALHGGRIEALARAWGAAVVNKEVVRAWTKAEHGLATRGYLRDEARWAREFARRYFAGTAAAIREADPNHLVLGCRGGTALGESVRAECVYPAVDVALLDWTELPASGAGPVRQAQGGSFGGAQGGPVLAGDVCWADVAFREAPVPQRGGRKLTTVERMLRRGRAALERVARHPAVTGFVWRQWLDEPGEQPPFARGLVHQNGAEAREHTELLTTFNARVESLRRAPARELVSP
jgi:hypothetical protein